MSVLPLLSLVQDDLERVESLLEEVTRAEYPAVTFLLQHTLLNKGKRLRPALVLLSAKFYEYRPEVLLPTAAAIELLHTATLIHDDLIDNSGSRRGLPTVNSLTSGRAAVLVGDLLFAKSAVLAVSCQNLRAIGAFSRALVTLCDGELREVLSDDPPEQARQSYFRRIESKTASLFSAATETGGILSGAPEAAGQALRSYGHNLGMAFQIVDDVLDFVGDEQELGKPVGSDLRQGILTLPAIQLMELFPQDNPVSGLLRGAADPETQLRRTLEMIHASPAIELCYEEARRFTQQARSFLESLPDQECRRVMGELADYVVERRS